MENSHFFVGGYLFITMKIKNNYAVYVIKQNEEVKYVGKTCDFKRRKNEHLIKGSSSQIPDYVPINEVEVIPVEWFANEIDALDYEDKLMIQYDTIDNGWNNRLNNIKNKKPNLLARRYVPLSALGIQL